MPEPSDAPRRKTPCPRLSGTIAACAVLSMLLLPAASRAADATAPRAPADWRQFGVQLRPTLQPQDETSAARPLAPSATPAQLPAPRTTPTKRAPDWPQLPAPVHKGGATTAALVWSTDEIKQAKALCATLLADVAAVAVPEEPFREGRTGGCGDAAPVRLMSIGKSPQVVLSPPALVSCRMAAALGRWVEKDLQPLARKHLKTQVVQIEVMSDYSCRAAYGRRAGRLSEHARANALDIGVFRLADRSTVSVLTHWGPTGRDILAAKVAAEKEALKRAGVARSRPTAQQPGTSAAQPTSPTTASSAPAGRTLPVGLAPASRLGGPKADAGTPPRQPGQSMIRARGTARISRPITVADGARSRFLRSAHERGCRLFGTILGPEANEAHRNHLHIDMAERTRGSFCE